MTITPEELEALSDAATYGPWRFDGDWHRRPVIHGKHGVEVCQINKTGHPNRSDHTTAQAADAAFITALVNLYRTGHLVLVDDAAVERVGERKRKFPSRWNWPPSATEDDVQAKIDSICGCAGKNDCDCVSVFNRACSEMWFDYNTKVKP